MGTGLRRYHPPTILYVCISCVRMWTRIPTYGVGIKNKNYTDSCGEMLMAKMRAATFKSMRKSYLVMFGNVIKLWNFKDKK